MIRIVLALWMMASLAWAQGPKWEVSLGTREGGQGEAYTVSSSGDIWRENLGAKTREVTGVVNQDYLQALQMLLADPELAEQYAQKSAPKTRFLKYTYGDVQKTFVVEADGRFPERVSRIEAEVERALRAAKQ